MPCRPRSPGWRTCRNSAPTRWARVTTRCSTPQGAARAHYEALHDRLQVVDPQEMRNRQTAADLAFLHQGITFTVYGQGEGTERIFPYDLIPRIITAAEWAVLEKGLTQRITTLNLFLKDIYSRRPRAEGRHRPARTGLQLQALPPGDAGRRGAARRLRVGRGHGPGARARRLVRRARGQPARAERRQLHADQPAGDQARVPAAVQQLRRAAGGSLRPAAAGHAARAGARTSARIRPSCC